MLKIKSFVKDQKGQALVEFGLIFCIYTAVVFMLIMHGAWLYNNYQVERAARHGAVYLGTTNNVAGARAAANDYLGTTLVFTTGRTITPYWSGSVAMCQVQTEMTTFFPGIPKLLNRSNPVMSDTITIRKEAVATGEHKYTHSSDYNH